MRYLIPYIITALNRTQEDCKFITVVILALIFLIFLIIMFLPLDVQSAVSRQLPTDSKPSPSIIYLNLPIPQSAVLEAFPSL